MQIASHSGEKKPNKFSQLKLNFVSLRNLFAQKTKHKKKIKLLISWGESVTKCEV